MLHSTNMQSIYICTSYQHSYTLIMCQTFTYEVIIITVACLQQVTLPCMHFISTLWYLYHELSNYICTSYQYSCTFTISYVTSMGQKMQLFIALHPWGNNSNSGSQNTLGETAQSQFTIPQRIAICNLSAMHTEALSNLTCPTLGTSSYNTARLRL